MFKFKFLIVTLLLAAAGYYGYTKFASSGAPGAEQAAGGPQMPPPSVSVAEVVVENVRESATFSGRLTAAREADIRPQVSGVIQAVHFKNGQQVKKGDPLFTIDPRPYEAALGGADARAHLAEEDFRRAQPLLEAKAISQREFDERKNALDVARAEQTRARLDLDYARVRAPIAGKVGRAEVTEGNLVNIGEPLLTRVVAYTPIYADFEVDETNYIHLGGATKSAKTDVPVTLVLPNGETRDGHVEAFDNRIDTASGTVRARAVFENKDGALIPGQFVTVRMGSVEEISAILISDRAMGTDQTKKFVLVVKDDNTTERREIIPGGTAENGLRIVTSGLSAGEKIIVSGMQRVFMPGMPVAPEMEPMQDSGSGIQDSGVPPAAEAASISEDKTE